MKKIPTIFKGYTHYWSRLARIGYIPFEEFQEKRRGQASRKGRSASEKEEGPQLSFHLAP